MLQHLRATAVLQASEKRYESKAVACAVRTLLRPPPFISCARRTLPAP